MTDSRPEFTIVDRAGEPSDAALEALAELLLAVAEQEPRLFTAPVNANRFMKLAANVDSTSHLHSIDVASESASVSGKKEEFDEMDRDQQRKLDESLAKETGIKGSHDQRHHHHRNESLNNGKPK